MNIRLHCLLLCTCVLAAGCAASGPYAVPETEPWFASDRTARSADRGVALVLSSGGARGFAHVGVLKVLEANGLRPDIIVGCSAGSVVGALYASGLTAAELDAVMAKLDASAFSDWTMPGIAFLTSPLGFVKGDGLRRFVDDHAKLHAIEAFPIRFGAVATDLVTGEVVVFNAGDVGRAVHASSAVPGLVSPARISGRLYGDCQVSSPLPVKAARLLGAKRIVAVDVIYPPVDAGLTSSMRVVFQAFAISTYHLKEFEAAMADVVIAPQLPRTSGQLGFEHRQQLIAAGEQATREMLERLRPLFRN